MGLFKRLKKFFAGKRRNSGELRGKRYEKRVARRLKRKGVNVVAQGKKYFYRGLKDQAEIDIETPNTAIEVKSGRPSKLEERLLKYKEVLPNKDALAYAPKISNQHFHNLRKKKFMIFKDFNLLTDHLYNKGEFTMRGARKYKKYKQRRPK